jgi:hypothetical protein
VECKFPKCDLPGGSCFQKPPSQLACMSSGPGEKMKGTPKAGKIPKQTGKKKGM